MARKAPDPSARIAQLKAARKKLARMTIKHPFNAEEMASACGVSWRTLKGLVDADPNWPCLMRGSEGVSYQFRPLDVVDYWIKLLEKQRSDRIAKAERIAKLAGFPPEMAATGMSLEELRHLDAMQVSMQRRKIEQGAYVPLAHHEAVIIDIFTTMQTETLATVSRLDPAGKWPPAVRAAVADAMKSLLVRLHNKLGAKFDTDAKPTGRTGKRARAARR